MLLTTLPLRIGNSTLNWFWATVMWNASQCLGMGLLNYTAVLIQISFIKVLIFEGKPGYLTNNSHIRFLSENKNAPDNIFYSFISESNFEQIGLLLC